MDKRIIIYISILFFCIYCLLIAVLSYQAYYLEQSKYQLLSDQLSLSVRKNIMAQDIVGIRMSINNLLSSDHLVGVSIDTGILGIVESTKKGTSEIIDSDLNVFTLTMSNFLVFNDTYELYPRRNEKYRISFIYQNTAREGILLSSLAVTLIIFLSALFFIMKSRNVIKDKEKSKLAANIFHLIRSDVLQVNSLVEKYHSISMEDRILMKNLTQTILGTASKFINDNKKIYNRLDKHEIFSLSDLIDNTIRGKNLEYSDRNISMIFNKKEGVEHIKVKAVLSDLRVALSNIVNNSFDAMKEGSIFFDLTLNGNIVIISISDNGPGIDAGKVDSITKGRSYKKNGNGIGVPQTIEIIESFGGEIVIESDKGQGMTTKISLLADSTDKIRYTQEQIDDFRYILIEDSKVRRVNFETEAACLGVDVGTFSGHKEFKEFLKLFRFNQNTIIYTDSNLGEGVDGEESARELFYFWGFKDIRLLTAKTKEMLKHKKMPWISKIIAKSEGSTFLLGE